MVDRHIAVFDRKIEILQIDPRFPFRRTFPRTCAAANHIIAPLALLRNIDYHFRTINNSIGHRNFPAKQSYILRFPRNTLNADRHLPRIIRKVNIGKMHTLKPAQRKTTQIKLTVNRFVNLADNKILTAFG